MYRNVYLSMTSGLWVLRFRLLSPLHALQVAPGMFASMGILGLLGSDPAVVTPPPVAATSFPESLTSSPSLSESSELLPDDPDESSEPEESELSESDPPEALRLRPVFKNIKL